MDIKLKSYNLTNKEKLLFPFCSPYGIRHIQQGIKSKDWKEKTIHWIIGGAEVVPLIGAIVSLFELAIVSLTSYLKTINTKAKDSSKKNFFGNFSRKKFFSEKKPSSPKKEISKEEFEKVWSKVNEASVQSLFSGKGFKPDPFDKTFNGSVGEVQGSSELRYKTAKMTKENPSLLSPKSVREGRDLNEDLFRTLQIKRAAHAFSCKDAQNLKNLEGFSETFTLPMMAESLNEFPFKAGSPLTDQDKEWLKTALMKTITTDNALSADFEKVVKDVKNPLSQEVTPIATGYDWHLTQLVIYKGHLIYCNRGADHIDNEPGIHVYKIGNSSKLTADYLKRLSMRLQETSYTYINEKKLIQDLKLSSVHYERQTPQKGGFCTWTNTKSLFQTLLAIKYLENHPHPLNSANWASAFKAVKPIYKDFLFFDKKRLLEDLLLDTPSNPQKSGPMRYENKDFKRMKNFTSRLLTRISTFRNKSYPELIEKLKKQYELVI